MITFKKGFYIGAILGLILVVIGGVFVNKLKEDSTKMGALELEKLNYTDLNGNQVKLADYSQDKNVLINFWATWCVPCVNEFPLLNEVYDALKDDFVFIVVSDESIDKINKFSSEKPYKFTYLKTDKFLLNGVTSIPQTFVLDSKLRKIKYHPSIFEGSTEEVVDLMRSWVGE